MPTFLERLTTLVGIGRDKGVKLAPSSGVMLGYALHGKLIAPIISGTGLALGKTPAIPLTLRPALVCAGRAYNQAAAISAAPDGVHALVIVVRLQRVASRPVLLAVHDLLRSDVRVTQETALTTQGRTKVTLLVSTLGPRQARGSKPATLANALGLSGACGARVTQMRHNAMQNTEDKGISCEKENTP